MNIASRDGDKTFVPEVMAFPEDLLAAAKAELIKP